ncbi:hypothetical protein HCN44_002261 [Aphidius gifuensis]|uniref:ITPR-interacting domain-containing protein n=2 Tax=Aphidius gifuensis TaxID=684658 RepID=A0A834XZN1_APHGI|nr:uncharacterized protein DDB_G0273453/DDB_G0273565 isoform X2 [Aphidius gifuensis]KAF7996615.1 hypothetical protein HCN44_002261 [Aphidius gifuensis]
MKRRGGPSVQQWIDSIPSPIKSTIHNDDNLTTPITPTTIQTTQTMSSTISTSTTTTTTMSTTASVSSQYNMKNILYSKNPVMTVSTPKSSAPNSPVISALNSSPLHGRLVRDPSLQSDSSHCSSVESLLELRKADPEAILLGLGFGGCTSVAQDNGPLSRIPKRFLQPSKLKGIAINNFVKQQQETSESIDTASLGYRGLTGSPFVAPSEIVQKIMERLRDNESHEIDAYSAFHNDSYTPLHMQDGRLSVLSPDSRQFVQRSRSISPDMRNKRMIIGQKSFAFGCDGDLIEINPLNHQNSNRLANINSTDYQDDDDDDDVFTKSRSFNIENINYIKHNNNDDDDDEKSAENIIKLVDNNKHQILYRHIDEHDDDEDGKNNNSSGIEIKINNDESNCWDNINDTGYYTRRSSDSFCELKKSTTDTMINNNSANDERRSSDGLINNETSSIDFKKRKRNSLKRQARISDEEAAEYFESLEANTLSSSSSPPSPSSQDELKLQKGNKVIQCDTNKYHLCCKSDELGQICGHKEDTKDCCYHDANTNCWKKMKQMMKKNQKLENMVVKNRREMAEIREMLNNVLSIRMEPGF